MAQLFWLSEEHVSRIRPLFPRERGVRRADDRKVLSGGIINGTRRGRLWPHKALYNRFRRW